MKIIKPQKKYLLSYLCACKETYNHVHDNYILHNPAEFDTWKDDIFIKYYNQSKGKNLPDNFVPSETYWITDKDEYIGTINIRLYLNDELKKYGGHAGFFIRLSERNKGYAKQIFPFISDKVKSFGEQELLMTCEKSNTCSRKLLEQWNPYKIENSTHIINNKFVSTKKHYYNLV